MNAGRLTAVLCVAIGMTFLAGCTGNSSTAPDADHQTTAKALTLVGDPDAVCYAKASRDLAVFDVMVQANEPLTIDDITLVDPVGVTTRFADAVTLPPINYGGRINASGSSTWPIEVRLLVGQTSWTDREKLQGHLYNNGETALPVIHVIAKSRASFGGYTFHYTTESGAKGEATYNANYTFRPHCG